MGLQIEDTAGYQAYRDAMTPLLEKAGGSFRYDFRIQEVLKSETGKRINRVFIISFPDKATREAFFSSPDYLAIREKYFNPSVGDVTKIAEYEN
jgi:uncharacterized protein (DUF1330 family)